MDSTITATPEDKSPNDTSAEVMKVPSETEQLISELFNLKLTLKNPEASSLKKQLASKRYDKILKKLTRNFR